MLTSDLYTYICVHIHRHMNTHTSTHPHVHLHIYTRAHTQAYRYTNNFNTKEKNYFYFVTRSVHHVILFWFRGVSDFLLKETEKSFKYILSLSLRENKSTVKRFKVFGIRGFLLATIPCLKTAQHVINFMWGYLLHPSVHCVQTTGGQQTIAFLVVMGSLQESIQNCRKIRLISDGMSSYILPVISEAA